MNLSLMKTANRVKFQKCEQDFKRIFGKDLKDYFDNLIGFNITYFDLEFIKTPAGKSMKDVVDEKYGNEGVEVIQKLLGKRK